MANATNPTNAPLTTVGDNLSLQGYTQGLGEDAAAWLSTEVQNGSFKVPEGYDVKGEVFSAGMKLMSMKARSEGKDVPVLSVATRESVLMFFKDMVSQGLSFSNSQCYAILYGDQLTLRTSYHGKIASLLNIFPDYIITANVIYDGDEYEESYNEWTDSDEMKLIKRGHKKPDDIIFAYGYVKDKRTKETIASCVMDKDAIHTSWSHAQTNKVQNEFPQEMAKRTVINRMLKGILNTLPSNRNNYQVAAYQRSVANEYEQSAQNPQDKPRKNDDLASIMASAKAKAEEIPF